MTDDLRRMLRSAQRALAKSDPATYIEYVTGMEPAAHHRRMLDFALDIIDRKAKGVVLAPRGSGKTTILNTGLLPWLIANRPDIRIGLLSQKAEKAEAMSGAVKAVLSESPESIEVFGNLRGSHKWSDSEWLVKGSPHYRTKDRTMVAAGADASSSVVSKRFDLVFCHEVGTLIFDGEWMEVVDHPSFSGVRGGEGIEIAVRGIPFTETVTPEHRYWTIGVPDEHKITPARRVGFGAQGWTEARDLTREHAIGWPIDMTVEAPQPIPWSTNLAVGKTGSESVRSGGNDWQDVLTDRPEFDDPDWWWLLGLWWGDGHTAPTQVGWTVSSEAVHERLTTTLERHGLKWYRSEKEGCWQVVATSTRWSRWLKTWQTGIARKQPPEWVERVSPLLQAKLIRGYIDADGHTRPDKPDIRITSIHLDGLLAARRVLARIGIPSSIRQGVGPRVEMFRGGQSPTQTKYDLRFRASYGELLGYPPRSATYHPNGTRGVFIRDGFLWSRVKATCAVSETWFAPIQTDDHTYLTHFGRSHNCDDVLDENNTYNIDRREKIETWFWKTLKPTQAAEGSAILVVGTVWVEGDLYQQLVEVNKWESLVIPAITQDEAGEDVSYWPAVWPLSRLYAEREDVGWDNFAASYLNSVTRREGAIFKADWWRESYFEALPRDRTYTFTIGIDLATSVKERADYTAGCVVARDDRNEWWVLHHSRVKTDDGHKAFVQGLWDWCAEQGYPVSRIVMESNQAQEAIVTAIQRQTPLPVIGRRTDTDKRAKARGAATFYEARRVHHHNSLKGRELESELRSFDKGHDDLVDALCLAMDITGHSGTTLGVSVPERGSTGLTGALQRGAETIPFRDGPRQVPAYVASLLRGIPTETMSYEVALQKMNASMLDRSIKSILPGLRR